MAKRLPPVAAVLPKQEYIDAVREQVRRHGRDAVAKRLGISVVTLWKISSGFEPIHPHTLRFVEAWYDRLCL